MEALDLSDVDPLKWAEVRRRAQAVQEYLELPLAGVADRERLGASLGIGAQQFANLVKAWEATRNASALSPGSHRVARASRSKAGGVDPTAREVARDVIAAADPAGTLDDLQAAVAERCAALGVSPPSRSTTWLLAQEGRCGAMAKGAATTSLVVGRAFLRLPVETGAGIVLPEIAMAVADPSGAILAAAMPSSADPPDARWLGAALVGAGQDKSFPIEADERDAGTLAAVLGADANVLAIASSRASARLAKIVGGRVGRLELAYRRPAIRPSSLMQSGRDRAPGVEDARSALEMARLRHNDRLLAIA